MSSQVFINLPVTNVEASMAIYKSMGFTNNPQFSDNSAKCMVWSESIFVMLMSTERFKTFATKPIADTKNGLAGLFALSVESVNKMNVVCESALKAGATEPSPMKDHGFMQQRNIEDFDGHTWEIFFMDLSKFPQQ